MKRPDPPSQNSIDEDLKIIEQLLEIGEDPENSESINSILSTIEFHSKSLDIRSKIHQCHSCELRMSCRRPVPFIGQSNRNEFVALGEAPGYNEDVKNQGFCGKSGQLIDKSAEICGVEISDYINVCCCRPPDNRAPNRYEIDECRSNLKSQISHLDPWMIIAFGGTALDVASGSKGIKITTCHGIIFKTIWKRSTGHSIWGFSMYHPTYILRAMDTSKKPAPDQKWKSIVSDAILTCQKWQEDWVLLGQIAQFRRLFGVDILYSFKEDLIDHFMTHTMNKAPFIPGDEEKTKKLKKLYLDEIEERQMRFEDPADIPF